jgi:membrane-bound lytic murein transglycosylase D
MQCVRTSLLAAVIPVLVAGCEDAAHKPLVASQPNVPALRPEPEPQVNSQGQTQNQPQNQAKTKSTPSVAAALPALPLWTGGNQTPSSLSAPLQDEKAKLIARVQEKFASGEQNFKAGHLDTARRDFDAAVDLLLESGYDLEGDPQLHELFHHVVDSVYTYELQAFQAGDGFQETPAVPAPIDEVAEMTFPVDPRLKDRAEEAAKTVSHDMPLTVNDEVLSFLNFFQTPRGKAIVEVGLSRSGRYREMISRILREEGVPQDLIYLAQAESAFQPLALSRAGARGIWQFVPWRGNEYGLKRSWWVDQRQDPEKATRAAAQHLRDLYGLFGDWYLAMAAYNCGPGNIQKGIERTGYADFWELYRRNVLPRETKNYVPIIIALTLIAKDAAHYGIQADPEKPVPYDLVKPGRPIDLRLVAETIDVDVETLRSLNPSLLRLATPDDPAFELHLPVGTADKFSAEIADIPPEKWVSWRRHRVEPGETLSSLARQYKVTVAAIAAANSLGGSTALTPGDKLIIPAAQPASETKGRLVRYRVRKGDTLEGIADQFSVTSDQLRKWNALKTAHVGRGMVLRVYTLGGAPEAHPVRKKASSKKPGSSVKTAASTSAAAKTP